MKKAVVLGATGAVGAELVKNLLASSELERLTTLGRRGLDLPNVAPGKLVHEIVDVFNPTSYEKFLAGNDTAFCTMGMGQPSKATKEEFYRVDVTAPTDFAKACKRQGIEHFSLLTAVGTNIKSSSLYLRIKGEVEKNIRELGFKRTSFFRPSMIMTPTNRYGLLQGLTLAVFPYLDHLLVGPLKAYRSIRVEDLGRAMAANAEKLGQGVETLTWSHFQALLRNSKI